MSPPRRAALIAAAKFVVVLVALAAPWPRLGRTYVDTYGRVATAMARPVFEPMGTELSFAPSAEGDTKHEWAAMVFVLDPATHVVRHKMASDLRRTGYLQMVFYLAVAAAFPLRDRVRGTAWVAAGLLLFASFGWLPVLMYLAKKQVIVLGAWSFSALAIVYRSVVTAPAMAYAVPGLLWLAIHSFGERGGAPWSNRLENGSVTTWPKGGARG
jgi:hypothetical protein